MRRSAFPGRHRRAGRRTDLRHPLRPWSKGVTERWFRTFEERCGKTFATYCGHSASTKPESLEAIRRGRTGRKERQPRQRKGRRTIALRAADQGHVPTLAEARSAVGDFIALYHHTPHSAEDMNHRTPLEVWEGAPSLHRAGEDELLFLMQTRGVYRVGPNGISFKLGGVTIRYGAGNPALYRWTGRDVLVTVDLHDLTHCFAFTPDRERRRFIARLDPNRRISPMASIDELREAQAAVGRRRRVMHQATRASAAGTRSAVHELAAQRPEHVNRLRTTGIGQAVNSVTVVPVRTGFEGASRQVRETEKRSSSPPDRKARDLAAAKAALCVPRRSRETSGSGGRVADELLGFTRVNQPGSAFIEDDQEADDADAPKKTQVDLQRLVAEDLSHE